MYNFSKFFHKKNDISFSGSIPDMKDWPREWLIKEFKAYSHVKTVKLPVPKESNITLIEGLARRKSKNQFTAKTSINILDLSTLLFYAGGLNQKTSTGREYARSYPSGGGRYPLEIYPVVLSSSSIEKGVYHYNVLDHTLEAIRSEEFTDEIRQACFSLSPSHYPAAFILISTVFDRTLNKYPINGYKLILLEAGALMQNLYLVAGALNLGISALGGFNDTEINEILDFDGNTEGFVLGFALGNSSP